MEDPEATERLIIGSFVPHDRRDRLLGFIGNPRARDKVRRELLDLRRLEQQFVVPIPPVSQTSAEIRRLLEQAGAPARCYVISENPDWDALWMPLADALDSAVGSGWSTLVSCRPDALLFHEGEIAAQRAILSKQPLTIRKRARG
jgi:hypothetical protein